MVYICSPLKRNEKHTMAENLENANYYCEFAIKGQNETPMCPHLFFAPYLNDNFPEDRELGIKLGLEALEECSEIWVFGDFLSDGMAKEIVVANEKGIPIRFYTEDCERRGIGENKKL